jgi:putative membrane protein
MRSTTAALSLVCGLLLAGAAEAHDRSNRSTALPTTGSASAENRKAAGPDAFLENDKLFLWRVHWINHNEIQAGELAKANGTFEGVAAYGKKLAADHRKSENTLVQLAKRKNLQLELTRDEYKRVREELSRQMTHQMDLAHEKGASFDRPFLQHMVRGHGEAIELLRAYRAKTEDPQILSFIDETLPVIQDHHRTASTLLDKLDGDREDVKGVTDEDVEKKLDEAVPDTKKDRREKKRQAEPEEGTDRQEDIETDIERRVEPEPDSGEQVPDLDPL